MRISIKIIPQEIIDKYKWNEIEENGWVYIKIVKGIYGLPQAGKISHELPKKRLAKAVYHPTHFTPGLWKHVWISITFTLVVDNFVIKVEGNNHANHIASNLKKYYDITVDWKGELFVGIKLKWDYYKRTLDTHIPNFVPKALHKYQHAKPKRPQHAQAKAVTIQYGANIQVEESKRQPPHHYLRKKGEYVENMLLQKQHASKQ